MTTPSTGLADHLFDTQITPDPGSINPFVAANANLPSDQTYTIRVTRTDGKIGNELRLHANTGWIPAECRARLNGWCIVAEHQDHRRGWPDGTPGDMAIFNRRSELAQLQPQMVPPVLENPPTFPPVSDRIWFGPPAVPPPLLLPNPDNKYLVSFFMPGYEPGRMIVIRGKMPGFPDTYNGAPISQPARPFSTVQLRYWEICQADGVAPLKRVAAPKHAGTPRK